MNGSTINSVVESSPGCASDYGVWYTFTGDGSEVVLTTQNVSLDTELALFSGSCGGLVPIGCADATSAASPDVYSFVTTVGIDYYVYVAYYGSGSSTGDFTISLDCLTPPVNDDCANATSLVCGATLNGSTENAISEPTPGCPSDYGVWYTFTGDGSIMEITTQNVSLDTEFELFSGSCGSLTSMTCEDASGASNPEVYSFGSVVGVDYFVYVSYYGTGTTTGDFTISLDCIAPPTNDDCSNASILVCGTTVTGTTDNTASETSPGCGSDYGVWYTFTGDGTIMEITTQNVSLDTEFELFSGACGSLTSITCEDASGASNPEVYSFASVVGVDYFVYVSYYGSGTTTGDFTISLECVAPPTNDACSNASTLVCGSTVNGTTQNTAQETSPGCGSDYGVWYTFTGDGSIAEITTQNVSLDISFGLYSGSCGSLANITCEDASGAMNPEVYSFPTTAGVDYYVYVSYFEPGNYTGDFTIGLNCIPPPTNDDCSNATEIICGTSGLTGTTIGTVVETAPGTCGLSDYGVWYTFTGTGDISTIDLQATSGFDTGLSIYSGSCSSLVNLVCEDAPNASDMESGSISTVAGTQYYVYVAYFESSSLTGNFTISHTCSANSTADCAGATQICSDQTFSSNSSGYGNIQELNSSNHGCYAGGSSTIEDQTSWYYFQAQSAGVLEFTLTPSDLTTDYDFIIWGPNSGCDNLGAPIRCNAAGTSGETGMTTLNPDDSSPVTNTSSAPGFSSSVWIQSLAVNPGETYILMVDNFDANGESFTMDWHNSSTILNCNPIVLPVELVSFVAKNENRKNVLIWNTVSEHNNDYFTLERSIDGENWNYVAQVSGQINSTSNTYYVEEDRNYIRNAVNYYRLSQTDLDGQKEILSIESVDNTSGSKEVLQTVDLSGRIVNKDYKGFVIIQYTDGTSIRVLQ